MRFILLVISFMVCTMAIGQNDYLIHINDTVFELTLDKEYNIQVNNELVKVKVNLKDTLVYDDILYSFRYTKDYKISKTVIEEGMEQIMLMTADGSGILIQQYTNFNPTMLNEMMINEVTKESLNYGFKMKRKDYKHELISGQKLDVDKVVLRYRDEVNIYEVASIGNKDEGVIIMAIKMDDYTESEGQKIIDLMWDSFTYK